MANFFIVENVEECNISVGIRFHRLDKTQVWTAYLEFNNNDKMWSKTQSSCLDYRRYHALQGIMTLSAELDIIIQITSTYK